MHTKHHFVSSKADGTDATLVKPTAWNADHDMTTDADGVVLGRSAGAGAGPVQELPFAAVLPYGTVLPFAGATSPSGWLVCDGSSLPGHVSRFVCRYRHGLRRSRRRALQYSRPPWTHDRRSGSDGNTSYRRNYFARRNTLGGVGGAQTEAAGVNVGSWGGGTFSAGGYTTGRSRSITVARRWGKPRFGRCGVRRRSIFRRQPHP